MLGTGKDRILANFSWVFVLIISTRKKRNTSYPCFKKRKLSYERITVSIPIISPFDSSVLIGTVLRAGEEVFVMKRSIRAIILASMFTLLAVVFSALSCTVTPGGITITIYNNQGACIDVDVIANDLKIAEVNYGAVTYCSVNPNSVIKIYDSTHLNWLLFSDGGFWTSTYQVSMNVTFIVRYHHLDGWYVEVTV